MTSRVIGRIDDRNFSTSAIVLKSVTRACVKKYQNMIYVIYGQPQQIKKNFLT